MMHNTLSLAAGLSIVLLNGALVDGHGSMVEPRSRNSVDYVEVKNVSLLARTPSLDSTLAAPPPHRPCIDRASFVVKGGQAAVAPAQPPLKSQAKHGPR